MQMRTQSIQFAWRALIATTATLLPLTSDASEMEAVTPEALQNEWTFHGIGTHAAQNRMFYMEEGSDSKGVMIVSPQAYTGDVTVRYELMPMNAASVCVAILYASDMGEAETLTLPDAYDGSMGHWINEIDNYFFAFHNAAHDRKPFGIRFATQTQLGEGAANVMRSGEFHTIEIRRQGDLFTLYVNDERIFEGRDPDPLEAGHIAFRLRGIPQQAASALIRNLTIEHGGK
jgi:hypothetical protein